MRTGRILVTGGAGFVGSSVAVALAGGSRNREVIALDNLSRPGSELNLRRLEAAGVVFVRGDVREADDLARVGDIDALVECSDESSPATADGSPDDAIRRNLMGAYHCLELARRCGAQVIFLSTSRVYPARHLLKINLQETDTRFEIASSQELPGVSPEGIGEEFPIWGVRTVRGAMKLSAEHLIEDYVEGYGLRAVINRFGVIAGPRQAASADHDVFSFWMLAHYFKQPLGYIGFGGSGKQVRDLVHVDDVAELIAAQLAFPDEWAGHVGNVGGGRAISLSLAEATELCADITGNRIEVGRAREDRAGDIPVYLSDASRLFSRTDWRPTRDARQILGDVFEWIRANEDEIRRTHAGPSRVRAA